MIKRAGLFIASLTALFPRMAFCQHDPIQVSVAVAEVTFTPRPDGEGGTRAINADGQAVNLPFSQEFVDPIRAEFSVVPEVPHKLRISAGGADLSLELILSAPANNSATAKAKYFFHKRRQSDSVPGRHALYKIEDPFMDEVTVLVPSTGSSVELGKRMEYLGEKPMQTAVSTHISLTVLPRTEASESK